MAQRVKILSIDGGGIRGIIPAVILGAIQDQVGELNKAFDLIAGTSTGGIIALGLGTPSNKGRAFTPAELVQLYRANGNNIFPTNFLTGVKALFGPKYQSSGVEEVLQASFGTVRLSSALTSLVVASYDLQSQLPFFFKSSGAKTDAGLDCPIWEAARSTSAAPTFFPAYHFVSPKGNYALVDGGIYANNPAMAAYAEARRLFPGATEFVIVSVGTGDRNDRITYDQAKSWGLIGWARQIAPVMMDSASEAIDYELDWIVGSSANCRHYRLQPKLSIAAPEMDNVTPQNLDNLEAEAKQYLSKNSDLIQNVCSDIGKAAMARA